MALQNVTEYKPNECEDYMCERQLNYFRKYLLGWRRELVQSTHCFIDNLKSTPIRKPDLVDQSAVASDLNLDVQERYRQQERIRQIDHALTRIEDGEYGYCEVTGEEIGLKRLLARPVATMCVDVQERLERGAQSARRYAVPC